MLNFKNKPILGMIHLAGSNPLERALEEINILTEEGVSGIIIENYHGSIENVRHVLFHLQNRECVLGVNVLPNNYELALELAEEFNADFIQLDYVAGLYERSKPIDEQHFQNVRNKFLQERKYSDMEEIIVLGGIHPKYYFPVKDSILKDDIEIGMKRAEFIVCTGNSTGSETPLEKIKEFRNLLGKHPLIIGAGLNPSNVVEQLSIADGAIVGSCFKPYGITTEKIQRSLVKEFMDEVKKIR